MDAFSVLLTTSIVCVVAYFYTLWKTLQKFKNMGIPYIPGTPIIGNIGPAILQKIQIAELFEKFYYKFPNAKYFGLFDCNTPVIMIRDPELIKQIAIKSFDNFTDHYGFTTDADKLFKNALFSLRGDRWRDMRSLLSPTFTPSKLKQSFEIVSHCAKNFAENLCDNVRKGTTQVEMKEFGGKCTNDVICKYAFGINIDSVKNPSNEIYITGRRIFAFDGSLSTRFFLLKNFPFITKLFNIPLFTKTATDFFTKIIKDIITERDRHNIVNSDMLQIMVNASRSSDSRVKVNMDDIMSQTFIFFFGGFDTTSSYLSSTLHLLATHPHVQDKLIAEIDEIYEKTNGNPSYEDIQSMNYMDCVLNESGRIYPPVPYLERMCTKSFDLPPASPGCPPIKIEEGTTVYFPCYALHHDSQYFPNPLNFDPDRFLDKSITSDSGFYMPFGIGRRICIGARLAMIEMKLLIFYMLSRMYLKPSNKTVFPMKLAKNSFIVMSHNRVWLNVELRNKN